MTKTKETKPLFPDLWDDKAAFQKLIFKFATTKAVLAELKKHPRTGYWANSPEASESVPQSCQRPANKEKTAKRMVAVRTSAVRKIGKCMELSCDMGAETSGADRIV